MIGDEGKGKEEGSHVLQLQLLWMTHVYGQQGCSAYECKDMLLPNDFSLKGSEQSLRLK